MNPLQEILSLSSEQKTARGLSHTPAEIAQQPQTWRATQTLFREKSAELKEFLAPARDEKRTIFLIGAGTSDYIGRSFAALLRQRWGCEVLVTPSTDLLSNRDENLVEAQKYLWISFSRSGDSPEGVAVLEQALADLPNVMHLVITCNAAGKMAKLATAHNQAEVLVLDDATNDRSLAMTSSFTNMVLAGQFVSDLWSGEEAPVAAMCEAAEYLLDNGAALAKNLTATLPDRTCFVGAGVLAGAARESALKLLELTAGRVQTMFESTLGLRHGPMSALNTNTVLTAFVSGDATRRKYDLDLLREVHAKETTQAIVAIGAESKDADYSLVCDAFAKISDLYRAPVDVIFGQLMGLFASISAGLKPDTPSPQGVITRVVQPFTIYR